MIDCQPRGVHQPQLHGTGAGYGQRRAGSLHGSIAPTAAMAQVAQREEARVPTST